MSRQSSSSSSQNVSNSDQEFVNSFCNQITFELNPNQLKSDQLKMFLLTAMLRTLDNFPPDNSVVYQCTSEEGRQAICVANDQVPGIESGNAVFDYYLRNFDAIKGSLRKKINALQFVSNERKEEFIAATNEAHEILQNAQSLSPRVWLVYLLYDIKEETASCINAEDRYYGDVKIRPGVIPHGKGTKVYEDAIYTGDWVNGKQEGKGTYKFEDGTKYEGGIANGIPHGKGTYTFFNGDTYAGDVVNGVRTGIGTETLANGIRYEGPFVNGRRNGIITETFPNGDTYVGPFVNGLKDGEGLFTRAGETEGIRQVYAEGVQQDTGMVAALSVRVNDDTAENPGLVVPPTPVLQGTVFRRLVNVGRGCTIS